MFCYRFRTHLKTHEILDELEALLDDDDIAQLDVYIQPPEQGPTDETDADSGDEDSDDPNRLNRRQLQAPAELVVNKRNNDADSDVDSQTDGDPIEKEDRVDEEGQFQEEEIIPPKRKKRTDTEKKRQTKTKKRNWQVGDIDTSKIGSTEWVRPPPLTVSSLSEESEPIDFFKIFMNEDIIDLLVRHSVIYATMDKNNPNFQLSHDQMYTFIGIFLLSGYVPLPRRRMFWEEREDTHNVLVSNSMRRNKFEEIFRYFHVADNGTIDRTDKMAKIRPFLDKLNELFITYAPIEKDLSIDESMIPYFGRHGCKQFIKNKPVRFGYKAWVLATRLGYCVYTDLYCGRDQSFDQEVGLGGSVVLKLTSKLSEKYPAVKFSIYADNFFVCPKLLSKLKSNGFLLTGTVKNDRTEHCPLEEKSSFKKKARGTFDSRVDKTENIVAVRWNDNAVVTLLSTEFGVEPLKTAKRYSRSEHKKIDIPQPNIISHYNRNMGGVDQMDANVSVYRIAIRGKKWYMPIILWLIDVAFNNAYMLARSYKPNTDLLQFRRDVVHSLLLMHGEGKSTPGPMKRLPTRRCIPDSVRLHNADHIILTQQARRRCAICKNKTTKACNKCRVALHDKCFVEFHR